MECVALRGVSIERIDMSRSSTGEWSLQISRWNGHAVPYAAYLACRDRTHQVSFSFPHASPLASVARWWGIPQDRPNKRRTASLRPKWEWKETPQERRQRIIQDLQRRFPERDWD